MAAEGHAMLHQNNTAWATRRLAGVRPGKEAAVAAAWRCGCRLDIPQARSSRLTIGNRRTWGVWRLCGCRKRVSSRSGNTPPPAGLAPWPPPLPAAGWLVPSQTQGPHHYTFLLEDWLRNLPPGKFYHSATPWLCWTVIRICFSKKKGTSNTTSCIFFLRHTFSLKKITNGGEQGLSSSRQQIDVQQLVIQTWLQNYFGLWGSDSSDWMAISILYLKKKIHPIQKLGAKYWKIAIFFSSSTENENYAWFKFNLPQK